MPKRNKPMPRTHRKKYPELDRLVKNRQAESPVANAPAKHFIVSKMQKTRKYGVRRVQ